VNGEFVKNLEGRGLGLVEVMPRDWPIATERNQRTSTRLVGVSAGIRSGTSRIQSEVVPFDPLCTVTLPEIAVVKKSEHCVCCDLPVCVHLRIYRAAVRWVCCNNYSIPTLRLIIRSVPAFNLRQYREASSSDVKPVSRDILVRGLSNCTYRINPI
jgi:hypothetical protein